MDTMLMIDPPSGWKYGFPKKFDKDEETTLYEWLIDNGLPHELAELSEEYGCRYWDAPED